jgi:general secretion pathway protein L
LSTLYIRLPARVGVESAAGELAAPSCRFAVVSDGGTVMQQGVNVLGGLGELIAQSARVVLLLAASDVSLLRVQAPPLAGARLRAALPNLVEEQLIADPAECVVVPAMTSAQAQEGDGLLRVAVAQRGWVELLAQAVLAQGARDLRILPAQLCLPAPEGATVHAAVAENAGGDAELTVRLGAYDGLGLSMPAQFGDADAAADQALATLQALTGPVALQLHVPNAQLAVYQRVAATRNAALGGAAPAITVLADQWSAWIAGARAQTLDLVAGLNIAIGGPDWKRWRWPLILAAAIAVINIAALNADWWRLKREADTQRAQLLLTYKSAYPNETVIVEPITQMTQKVAAARAASGVAAPDDFLALAAAFSQAWSQSGQPATAISAVDYRDRALLVHFRADANAPFDPVRNALAGRNLALTQNAGAWELRSGK